MVQTHCTITNLLPGHSTPNFPFVRQGGRSSDLSHFAMEGGADGRKGRAQTALDVLETWIVELRNAPQATMRESVEQKVRADAPGLRAHGAAPPRPPPGRRRVFCRRRPDRRAGQGPWYSNVTAVMADLCRRSEASTRCGRGPSGRSPRTRSLTWRKTGAGALISIKLRTIRPCSSAAFRGCPCPAKTCSVSRPRCGEALSGIPAQLLAHAGAVAVT